MALLQIFSSINLATSSGLLAKVLVTYKEEVTEGLSMCKIWDEENLDFQCSYLIGGVVRLLACSIACTRLQNSDSWFNLFGLSHAMRPGLASATFTLQNHFKN